MPGNAVTCRDTSSRALRSESKIHVWVRGLHTTLADKQAVLASLCLSFIRLSRTNSRLIAALLWSSEMYSYTVHACFRVCLHHCPLVCLYSRLRKRTSYAQTRDVCSSCDISLHRCLGTWHTYYSIFFAHVNARAKSKELSIFISSHF